MSIYGSQEFDRRPPRKSYRLVALIAGVALATGVIHESTSAQQLLGLEKKPKTSPSVAAQTLPGATTSTQPEASTTSPSTTLKGVLSGKIIVIDPGHNGGNGSHPSEINKTISNGRGSGTERCDTVGSQTNAGQPESQYNMNVSSVLATILRDKGASVILTRTDNNSVGPCVTERAAIGNNAHADVAISIHADGGPPSGRGFTVLEPVTDPTNSAIVAPSLVLGKDLVKSFSTVMPTSTYDGVKGEQPRPDLGGLNMSTVPKVLIETGNMRNAADAALLINPAWQATAAEALATGLTSFLTAA